MCKYTSSLKKKSIIDNKLLEKTKKDYELIID